MYTLNRATVVIKKQVVGSHLDKLCRSRTYVRMKLPYGYRSHVSTPSNAGTMIDFKLKRTPSLLLLTFKGYSFKFSS